MAKRFKNFIITVDGDITSMQEFIMDNTAQDVQPISDDDIKAIESLKPGQTHHLPVQAGYAVINRPKVYC